MGFQVKKEKITIEVKKKERKKKKPNTEPYIGIFVLFSKVKSPLRKEPGAIKRNCSDLCVVFGSFVKIWKASVVVQPVQVHRQPPGTKTLWAVHVEGKPVRANTNTPLLHACQCGAKDSVEEKKKLPGTVGISGTDLKQLYKHLGDALRDPEGRGSYLLQTLNPSAGWWHTLCCGGSVGLGEQEAVKGGESKPYDSSEWLPHAASAYAEARSCIFLRPNTRAVNL